MSRYMCQEKLNLNVYYPNCSPWITTLKKTKQCNISSQKDKPSTLNRSQSVEFIMTMKTAACQFKYFLSLELHYDPVQEQTAALTRACEDLCQQWGRLILTTAENK